MPVMEKRVQSGRQGLSWGVGNAQHLRDGREDQVRVPDRREGDEDHAVGKVLGEVGGDLKGQPRLADPTRTGESHKGNIVTPQQRAHCLPLLGPAYERSPGNDHIMPEHSGFGPAERRWVSLQSAIWQSRHRLDPAIGIPRCWLSIASCGL